MRSRKIKERFWVNKDTIIQNKHKRKTDKEKM